MSSERDSGQIRLDYVLQNLKADSARDRLKHLKDLKAIFDKTNRAENLNSLTDKAYHKIYEVAFKIVLEEKANVINGKKTTLAKAQTRLETCGDAVRLAIKAGASKLKAKTVEAVLDHIIQTLPQADGEYFTELAPYYFKALNSLCEHKPNMERLKAPKWAEVVEFCVDGINHYMDGMEAEPSGLTRSFSALGTSSMSGSLAKSSLGNGHSQSKSRSISRQNVDELLSALFALVSAPNVSLLETAEEVATCALRFLASQISAVSSSHQLAFSIINAVLFSCREDRSSLLQAIARDSIPIISRFWQGRITAHDQMLNSVRDEALVLIFTVHLHLERSLLDQTTPDLAAQVLSFLEVLRLEYSKRSSRDQLQLNDLNIIEPGGDILDIVPFRLNNICLRSTENRAESNWANLRVIGLLERLISQDSEQKKLAADEYSKGEAGKHPRKRQRTSRHSDRLIDPLKSEDSNVRLAGLQILPFVLQECQLPAEALNDLLEYLGICASDKKGHIASWALISIASCAYQKEAAKTGTPWIHFWHAGLKTLNSQPSCRAAAALLHSISAAELVQYQEIGEDIKSIIEEADISGPVVLCDSSISFMMHILHARMADVPGASVAACHHVLRWMFAHWNPAETSSTFAPDIQPYHLIDLLRMCLRLPRTQTHLSASVICGPVAQAWQYHLNAQENVRYLLLLDERQNPTTLVSCASCPKVVSVKDPSSESDTSHFQATRKLILEHLTPKVSDVLISWTGHAPIAPSADTFQRLVYSCITMLLMVSYFSESNLHQLETVEAGLENLTVDIIQFLGNSNSSDPKATQAFIEILLSTIQCYLPPCESTGFSGLFTTTPILLRFLVRIAKLLDSLNSVSGHDMMDIDDDDEEDRSTQRSQIGAEQSAYLPRRFLPLALSAISSSNITKARLLLLLTMSNEAQASNVVPSTFIDRLLQFTDDQLLSSGPFLIELVHSDLVLNGDDAARLISHIGGFLTSREWDCEASHCLILDMLIGLGSLWAQADESTLSDRGIDLYQWFISVALVNKIVSPDVEKRIAKLLLLLLRIDPNEDVSPKDISHRTSLISLLDNGNASVKFYIGAQLPSFFELYITNTHDNVFVDILQHLPSDPGWIEGIAFRLFVLAKIASKWPHLLRRCIYHIFEVPPRIPESTRHATRCLKNVSSELKIDGPQELLALFAPQILFTYLESDSIREIPFQIFGYSTLTDMLVSTQQVAVGLMIMRGQYEAFEDFTELVGAKEMDLLESCFTTIMGYTIANTISKKPDKNKKTITGEAWVKNRLGSDLFFEYLNLHFVDIVALLFNTIDHGEVEKYFMAKKDLVYAGQIMREIRSLNASNSELPPNQQPAFKPKYLTDWIHHLCSRTQYLQESLYTPAIVTSVARTLLNTIHPALGPLHSCSVLRKLRVLIALSGDQAIRGYPLEMLLHSISAFVADPCCAADAFGIIQYLLTNGSAHLSKVPKFMAGVTLSIQGRLRSFLNLRQSSTTQDTQYRETKPKAQAFHTWMTNFATNYESPLLKDVDQAKFRLLVKSAGEIGAFGSAEAGTPESELLLQLLEDEQNDQNLLSEPSRAQALAMLCSDFNIPLSFRRDILGEDDIAIAHAAVVWKSCKSTCVSKEYLTWAGSVLGRAFAASGYLHKELLQESTLSQVHELWPSEKSVENQSRACVLSLLRALTSDSDQRTVGLAEAALRVIYTTADESEKELCHRALSGSLAKASDWEFYQIPPSEAIKRGRDLDVGDPFAADAIVKPSWLPDLTMVLARFVPDDPILGALMPILQHVQGFAERAFPFIIHLVLATPSQGQHLAKKKLSNSFINWFSNSKTIDKFKLKMLINSVLYLRTQSNSHEKPNVDRLQWLDIDYIKAALAATHCGMYKTALLFAEESSSRTTPMKSSRRSSAIGQISADLPIQLLLTIFQNIDDPDLYYGVQQNASLGTILARLEYEKDGPKSLAFRGAQYDSHFRHRDKQTSNDVESLVKALDVLSLSGISHSLLQSQQTVGMSSASLNSMFRTARKLEQWDIPVPSNCNNNSVTIYKAFQAVHNTTSRDSSVYAIHEGLNCTMSTLLREELSANALRDSLQTLAVLVELDEVTSTRSSLEFESMLSRFKSRSSWMRIGRFDDISEILSCRGTTLSTLSQNVRLQNTIGLVPMDARLVQVQTALLASDLNRSHNALQESLSLATSLMDLIPPCQDLGLNLEVAIHLEAANALWDQGEMASSIGMLQNLEQDALSKKQTIAVGRSDLLSRIGSQVSVARLEKPDKILENYLKPALKELRGRSEGNEAGEVFHQFAVFCDQQLQDPDGLEDLERLRKLKQNKSDDVAYLETMYKSASTSKEKERIYNQLKKNRTWLKIDNDEFERLVASRDEFLRQCLENYLLALKASDDHDRNALRFTALWLEHSEGDITNETVSKHLDDVPSRKLAPLMNQLSSRLQRSKTQFQALLFRLVLRICIDHPYSGMYQIYATAHSRPNQKDETAILRHAAANKISQELQNGTAAKIWASILATNKAFCVLASEKDESRYKSGRKISFKDSQAATRLLGIVARHPIPPPTLHIKPAADLNYSNLPLMHRYEPVMSIAGGVSCPKIITALGSDGVRYKQLVKGSNDDLRQDAIMEQVFEQVSELLKTDRSTRQRDLSIRTYKVLPLTSTAGIIEFVPDTIPLHEYLIPAHERYYPKDIKGTQCRKEVFDVQNKGVVERVRVFRSVCDRFHPVMRHFFTERFSDPDEWFIKRLAYTRSTAAISILGHVLGLGDRHGHNILLDAKSGEVVHIDLGMAFEMGRILPVPETVPFRLTRDVVDGMGITKTEGVFRRCCEFTLEALRKESHSIMTILDVLRYDPLYNWSISPLRLAKLQEGQSAVPESEAVAVPQRKEKLANEPDEADRALTVVSKKLSKTLSVTATVNDLINQAVDEKNLAVLYSGWGAYV